MIKMTILFLLGSWQKTLIGQCTPHGLYPTSFHRILCACRTKGHRFSLLLLLLLLLLLFALQHCVNGDIRDS